MELADKIGLYLNFNPFLAIILVFLAGILSSFTPCVYPMIPIIVGYICGQGTPLLNSFILSLLYVLGMACVYSILGIIASLSGGIFGIITQSFLVYFIVANIFILFSLSSFGVFSIHIPSLRVQKRKGLFGAFILGCVSGLIFSPCITPVLGAILLYVATKKNIAFGTTILFTYALGTGLLIILLGSITGLIIKIPKPGPWMGKVRKFFGIIFFLIGEYLLIKAGSIR
ncbi:TPA: hypothetical protein DCX16_03390 [bacterium]|nr:hypothetical protein [bacterium]